jgi:hypothetical protein
MPIFVSHSFKDEAVYSALCLALDATGITRWDPESMALGDSLSSQLQSAIQACEVCVFVATRRSIESPWCLAELGAFWGSGKKVLMFMADPDLAEASLPPQFKGTLRADTAIKLIDAIRRTTGEYANKARRAESIFFATSGEYGSEKEWALLLDETEQRFDVCGVALGVWRKTNAFRARVLAKASKGCRVRFLFMHPENPLLRGLLYNEKSLASVVHDINESLEYYSELSSTEPSIQLCQIRVGMPHFFLTCSDRYAVITQYLNSSTWGNGPTWKCETGSPLGEVAAIEFEHLWSAGRKKA